MKTTMTVLIASALLVTWGALSGCGSSSTSVAKKGVTSVPASTDNSAGDAAYVDTTDSTTSDTTTSSEVCGDQDIIRYEIFCRMDSGHMHCGGKNIGYANTGKDADDGYKISTEYWYSPEIETDNKLKVRFIPAASQAYNTDTGAQMDYDNLDVKVRIKGKSYTVSTGLTAVGGTSKVIDLSRSISAGQTTLRVEVGDPKSDHDARMYCACADLYGWSNTACSGIGRASIDVDWANPYNNVCYLNAMYQWSNRVPKWDVFSGVTGVADNPRNGAGATWAGTIEIQTNSTVCLE